MSTLICGSIAYDTIMVFRDQFKNHILPDQLHILNVAFLVPDMRREFGGCAGNIAYSLKMLGGEPLVMATVGDDYQPYAERLDKLAIPQTYIRRIPDTFTAQAFITNDLDDNQITAFHPGAMNESHANHVQDAQSAKVAIISPDGRDGMLQHARECEEAGLPFIFDPGQGLPMFNGEELLEFIRRAEYVTVNDYEARLLQERTGRSIYQLSKHVKAFVVTLGAQGSQIYHGKKVLDIPCVKAADIVDPTGCGDAFRAGLLYGLANELDWQITAQLASLLGSIKIAQRGGQNHSFSRDEIAQRYRDAYGSRLW
ncbi:MAG TPA: carbohydrate kinase family protein [Burkholderiales bacterium]|nr:carbohydrate kinase family protein [Burkholderiales bacterium]